MKTRKIKRRTSARLTIMKARKQDHGNSASRASERANSDRYTTPKKGGRQPQHVPAFEEFDEAEDAPQAPADDKNLFVPHQARILRLLYTGDLKLKPDEDIETVKRLTIGQYVTLKGQKRTTTFLKKRGIAPAEVKFISSAIRASRVCEMLHALAPKKRTQLELATIFLELQQKNNISEIAAHILETNDAELYLFFLQHSEGIKSFHHYSE